MAGAANGEVLRPGEQIDFVRFAPGDIPPGAYERFEAERGAIRMRVCYCSVFDDCWVADDASSLRPTPVAQCPADWQQYGFPQAAP